MNSLTLDLLERMKSLIPEESGWFNTIKEWYKNARFTRRLIEELRTDEETSLLTLHVEDRPVLMLAEWRGRHVHWVIPAKDLTRGDNRLQVSLDAEAQAPPYLDAGSAFQDDGLGKQTVDLSVPRPRPAPNLELADTGEARHQVDCWAVFPGGFVRFALRLPSAGPVHLVLRLPEGRSLPWPKAKTERRYKLLEDLIDRVEEHVEKKLSALEEELRESRRRGDGHTSRLEGEVNDLRAYEELHRKQIDKAVRTALSVTMEYVIRESGFPDDLIHKLLPARPVTPVQPAPTPATTTVKPVAPPARTRTPAVPTGSMFGKLLFLGALASTAAVGFGAHRSNEARILALFTPSVRIDSLENGQLVPAGQEFQVAVTPESPWIGSLENTELKVTATGAIDGPIPLPRRFVTSVPITSQIFTFKAKHVGGPEETISLTAQLFKDDQPTGKADTVTIKAGGTAMDVAFLIQPTNLKPKEILM